MLITEQRIFDEAEHEKNGYVMESFYPCDKNDCWFYKKYYFGKKHYSGLVGFFKKKMFEHCFTVSDGWFVQCIYCKHLNRKPDFYLPKK